MKFSLGDFIGIAVIIAVLSGIGFLLHRVSETSKPCYQGNIERRAIWIEAHERCMVEENCIYEDWDIRRYDSRLAQQEACKLED